MINNKFLFFKTQRGFEEALKTGGISYSSIVFIKDLKTIWTHGQYFMQPVTIDGDSPKLPDLTEYVTESEMANHVFNALDGYATKKNVSDAIDEVLTQIPSEPDLSEYVTESLMEEAIQGALGAYATKADVQTEISKITIPTQDGNLSFKTINGEAILGEGNIDLQPLVLEIINDYYKDPDAPAYTGPNHVILTKEEYDALENYDPNTLYFIVERSGKWTFGDKFPIVFGDSWGFGGTFPITLN